MSARRYVADTSGGFTHHVAKLNSWKTTSSALDTQQKKNENENPPVVGPGRNSYYLVLFESVKMGCAVVEGQEEAHRIGRRRRRTVHRSAPRRCWRPGMDTEAQR
jgi:hypothetical protein